MEQVLSNSDFMPASELWLLAGRIPRFALPSAECVLPTTPPTTTHHLPTTNHHPRPPTHARRPTTHHPPPTPQGSSMNEQHEPLKRRAFLVGTGAVVAGALGARIVVDRDEASLRAEVFVAKVASYSDDLVGVVRQGLAELGLGGAWVGGKRVLLKPNLVEPSSDVPHINTHPAVVRAVAEALLGLGAREVFVAEGQGHTRDSELVLEQSGLGPVLAQAGIAYVDLNHDDVFTVSNRLGFTRLSQFHLPRTLKRADLIVSLPKLKTHHWAGVTLAMKNLFGVLPGVCYGWPKNVLHREGINESILDLNAAVRPHLAIVDGIVGMEGDGPIMGTPRHSGVLVMGANLPAVDATSARLMGIDPFQIAYLAAASGRLGPIAERHIHQRGEAIARLVRQYTVLKHVSRTGRKSKSR